MLAAISINHAAHQQSHGAAIKAGLERHGVKAVFTGTDQPVEGADFHVSWSIKRPKIFEWKKRTGRHVLVMERGYLPDRMIYTSMGWDGLNNRARFPECPDNGERFRKYFGQYLQDWQPNPKGWVLVCGQVPGDSSIWGVDLDKWIRETVERVKAAGEVAAFRAHPFLTKRGRAYFRPEGVADVSNLELEDCFKSSKRVVTFNSNTGVESVLHGIPTVTCDEGAMAWPVTSHDPTETVMPDREDWLHRLAYCQWSIEEITDGTAWEHLRTVYESDFNRIAV